MGGPHDNTRVTHCVVFIINVLPSLANSYTALVSNCGNKEGVVTLRYHCFVLFCFSAVENEDL